MPKLIGVNGLKTSGKDTTYRLAQDWLLPEGGVVLRAAFADKLKIMAMLALGYLGEPASLIERANMLKEDGSSVNSTYLTNAPFSGTIIPSGHVITGRQYLQFFGQHARAVFGENFWVDQVLPDQPIQHPMTWDSPAYLTDAAYEALQEVIDPWTGNPRGPFNYLFITDVRYPNEAERVLRLGGEVWEIVRPGLESDGHDTEKPLPGELVTRVIDNDSDIYALRGKVAGAL